MSSLTSDLVSLGESKVALPAGMNIADFKPSAYFDSEMDCIRVVTLNSSITEERVNESLTLFQTNHASAFDPQYCGFCLKGIHHLFDEIGLDESDVSTLTVIINALVQKKPQSVVTSILEKFPQKELEIDWAEAS